ncbi:hypothetical protein FRC17_004669 [Serendipita sp. 399]|nr:hypothetical protein FRC17_004669 [Serendipita sp. 399]
MLSPFIFRSLILSPLKVDFHPSSYQRIVYSTAGPEEFDSDHLHAVVRQITITLHIREPIMKTLNKRLHAFHSLVVLEIEANVIITRELYGHIRDHPTLRDLNMHMDTDRILRMLTRRQKFKTIPKCKLTTLRAPKWVLQDLLGPKAGSRESLLRLTVFHPNQVLALVGENFLKKHENPLLPAPPISTRNSNINARGLLPLASVVELRVDAQLDEDSGGLFLALLRGLLSLKELAVDSDTYLEPMLDLVIPMTEEPMKIIEYESDEEEIKPKGRGRGRKQQEQQEQQPVQLLHNLRSLSGPISVLTLLLPFLRRNVLEIHANDGDMSVWELIPEGYMERFLSMISTFAPYTQEIHLRLQVVTPLLLQQGLEAIPMATGFSSLRQWTLEWDTGAEVEPDRTLPVMMDISLTPLVGKVPVDCEVHLSLPGITDNLHSMVPDVNDKSHLEPVVEALERNRMWITSTSLLEWAKHRYRDIWLKSLFVRDWDVVWFAFRCVRPPIVIEGQDGIMGGVWEVEVDPDHDYAFARLRMEKPEEMVLTIHLDLLDDNSSMTER